MEIAFLVAVLHRTPEPRIDRALILEPSPEERANAFHVPIEIPGGDEIKIWSGRDLCRSGAEFLGHSPFRILVRGADHLWKVDDDWLARIAANENIELVVVAVDKSGACETDNNIHKFRIQLAWRGDFIYLTSKTPRDESEEGKDSEWPERGEQGLTVGTHR